MADSTKRIDDGGPVFPRRSSRRHYDEDGLLRRIDEQDEPGVPLRAWFAGMLLPEMLREDEHRARPSDAAANACMYADALIAELNKGRSDDSDAYHTKG